MKKRTVFPTVILALPLLGLLLLAACSNSTESEAPPPDPCEGLPQVTDTVTATPSEDPPEVTGKIVFSAPDSTANPQDQLFVMNADGSGLQQLTHGDGSAIRLAWSPDGQTIAYAGDSLGSASFEALWLIEADGSDPRPVKYTPGNSFALMGNVPDWHPDGDRLAYHFCIDCEGFGLNYEIYTVELESGNTRKLTENPAQDRSPAWSPDGERIVFVSNRDYPEENASDLYLMNANGENLKRITCLGTNTGRPIWFPEGRELLFWHDNNIYLLNMNEMTIRMLETSFDKDTAFRPLDISSDNQYLLLLTYSKEDPNEDRSLQIMDISNRTLRNVITISQLSSADWYTKAK
jgi:Tol biopolymer transport system component